MHTTTTLKFEGSNMHNIMLILVEYAYYSRS